LSRGSTLLDTISYEFSAIIFGDISHNSITNGETIAMEIQWPCRGHESSRSFVDSIDKARFTKRLPVKIVMRIFWGSCINEYIDLSFRILEWENRCRSDFFNARNALSDPEKNADNMKQSMRILISIMVGYITLY
jgi:hypothetical protein